MRSVVSSSGRKERWSCQAGPVRTHRSRPHSPLPRCEHTQLGALTILLIDTNSVTTLLVDYTYDSFHAKQPSFIIGSYRQLSDEAASMTAGTDIGRGGNIQHTRNDGPGRIVLIYYTYRFILMYSLLFGP
ncbi:hypothetical protein ACJJTC_006321 [Scirpophaga incertulas]